MSTELKTPIDGGLDTTGTGDGTGNLTGHEPGETSTVLVVV